MRSLTIALIVACTTWLVVREADASLLYVPTQEGIDGLNVYDPVSGTLTNSFGASLQSPFGVGFGPNGELYIGDHGSNQVFRYDAATGDLLGLAAAPEAPTALLVRANGNLLVSQRFQNNVAEYDSSGTLIRTFGVAGLDLELGSNGLLYVARNENLSSPPKNVYAFNLETGDLAKTLPIPDFLRLTYSPRGLAFHDSGTLFVSAPDAFGADRILTFDTSTNEFTGVFAELNTTGLADIDFGHDGHLYAAIVDEDRILVLDSGTGAVVRSIDNVPEPRNFAFAPIPEPSTLAIWSLLGLCTFGVWCKGSRKRH